MADEPAANPPNPEGAAPKPPEPAPKAKTSAETLADAALDAAKAAVAGLGDLSDLTGSMRDDTPAPPPAAKPAPAGAKPVDLPVLTQSVEVAVPKAIDLLSDVNLNVKIELGRTRMLIEDVLKLTEGAVVELDKLAGDPVDVYVNDRHVARGEVLVLNDNFCVRINEILSPTSEPAKAV
ncbi:MAG: flagellar motor switch protein FliN [Phycisphaerales bacterium]|jgi:flagellar motor switch protein FliN/FliY